MLISKTWLKRHISFEISDDELSVILTNLGLEVSKQQAFESIKGGLQGVVVGEVISCEQHPNADKLKVTKVDIGAEVLDIVCGAPNVAQGQKVALATVGTTLYPADMPEGLKLKKTKIRGEVSLGMICAEDELGLGTSHDGIMVLDAAIEKGTPLAEVVDMFTDTVYEIDLTPNRADAMSHLGVARDLRAYFEVHDIPYTSHDVFDQSAKGISDIVPYDAITSITVEQPDMAPVYTGINLTNIQIAESPQWLRNYLLAIGINPKNNIVDLSNFVLHDVGQPLHTFDQQKVKGNHIKVRLASEQESITTLDTLERKLKGTELVIADEAHASCIAGVMGSIDSGVSEQTTELFLESAYFDPVAIRKAAKQHQISSDASYRYERGIDPNIAEKAAQLFAFIAKEEFGAHIASPIQRASFKETEAISVDINKERIQKLIGLELTDELLFKVLHALDIKVQSSNTPKYKLSVPPYRVDVTREVDIAEEILRVYGMNKVKPTDSLNYNLPETKPQSWQYIKRISDYLTSNGYKEIMSVSFLDQETAESYAGGRETIALHNPLNQDFANMRTSLIPGALASIEYNLNRKQSDLKFYEIGKVYHQDKGQYIEQEMLQLALVGGQNGYNWQDKAKPATFFDLKGMLESLFDKLKVAHLLEQSEATHDKFSSFLFFSANQKQVACIGQLKSECAQQYKVDRDVYIAEIDLKWLTDMLKHQSVFDKMPERSKFQPVLRDLSLLIDQHVTYAEMNQAIRKTPKLKAVELRDMYDGNKIPEGKKSYTLRFTLSDEKKTLNEKEIKKTMDNIATVLEKQFAAQVRSE